MCSTLDRAPWDAPDADPPRDERDGRDGPDEAGEAALGELFAELDALWPPPGAVEDAAPGPYLAALVDSVHLPALDPARLVEVAAGAARLAAWAAARESAATAALTARCAALRGVGPGVAEVPPTAMAAVELGAALSLSPAAARRRVELAESLARLPATRAALAAGRIDLVKARAVAEAVAVLDDRAAAAVEARVIGRAPEQTASLLRAALRRAVIAADPAAADARRAAKVRERGVWRDTLDDGMSLAQWTAPTEQVETWWSWVTGRALLARSGDRDRARAQRDAGLPPEQVDPVRTLDQCRSDVLADLGDHGLRHDRLPTRHGREPHLQVVVAASTLLGADDEPAELVGAGPVTALVARRIAGDGVWRRLLTDPAGQLLDVSVDTYEPPQWMRDLVVVRDRTCRGPGCRMPAARCDLDHTVEWPCGPTCPANLCALCRTHHRVKTLTDTTCRAVTGDADHPGGHRWTLPSGHTYTSRREPALDHPALVRATARRSADGPPARGDPSAGSDPPDDDDLPPF